MEDNMEAKTNKNEDSGYVVGIGASAGGLEALQQLLENLPSNTGFPFIVVQHLSPDYKSLLAEILTKYTDMSVYQVENEMEVKPNCVYLIPPKNNMQLKNGKLILTEQIEGAFNHPIDIFFRSLAADAQHKAIAIILSGTGSDGTNGIKDIKEQEGFIIVQKADSAKFDGMPKSALRTGLVDAELNPAEIADELKHMAFNTSLIKIGVESNKKIDSGLMKRIYSILKKVSNINFTYYKQTTILRRIERRMVLTHKESMAEYVDYLYQNAEEVKILSKEVLIGVTSFFRDPEFFDSLKKKVITDIIDKADSNESVRIWVAGCSTGEEAYSVAILCAEVMEELKVTKAVKIFGTDLDVESISTAGKGVYGESISENVSSYRLSKYFVRKNNSYIVTKEIRKMVIFSPHNVFQDPPFGKLNLICCRNMMIYFQPILQRDLFSIFHSALIDGGYLFLGKSEAIGEFTDVFTPVDAAAKIFQHKPSSNVKKFRSYPFTTAKALGIDTLGDEDSIDGYPKYDRHLNNISQNKDVNYDIDTALLEGFMPACIVVNEKNEIVHTYGENSNYLHFAVGKASLNLFDTLTEQLKIAVSTILKEIQSSKKMISYKDIAFTGEHGNAVVNLIAYPLGKKDSEMEGLTALIFSEQTVRGLEVDPVPFKIDRASSQRITDLEQELKESKDKLRKSVSEQETVTEELQAANEELLTANEELQSSNEELQSVNEELYTVNAEYQQKLTELAETNDDMTNFLSTTLIGIMFIDNDLNIRKFTKYISSEFNVMDHDIGRPLKFIAYNFIETNIVNICNEVLKTLVPIEREVITTSQKAFLLRVAPYRTQENKILGLVITLVDLSEQKEDQKLLKSANVALGIAEQANSAKSDFLSRMSHEIRTPMNAIAGMTEIAKSNKDKPEIVQDCIDKISNAVHFMSSIVSDILDMSKIEQSTVELEYKPFSLSILIDNIQAMLNDQVKKNDLKFTISGFDKAPKLLFGDETRLQQILTNFLTNAIKYTPNGGDISLKLKECNNKKGKANLCFEVKDNGVGMSKEFIPKIFDPFSRESRVNGEETSSVGLGLSIAHNLVAMMHGYIEVDSDLGKGSKFDIHVIIDSLNSNDEITVLKSGTKEFINYQVNGLRALIAEDNQINSLVLQKMLGSQKMVFETAFDGVETVEKFINAKEKFDVILMDIRMPKISGLEACEKIRSSGKPGAKTVPIIGVSADAFAEDIHNSMLHGLTDYVIKPINFEDLFTKIVKYCKPRK